MPGDSVHCAAGKGIDTSGNAADVGTLKVHKKVKLIQIAMQTKLAFSRGRKRETGRERCMWVCTHTVQCCSVLNALLLLLLSLNLFH